MRISDLYHADTGTTCLPREAFIVGTGPSMDVFPRQILRGKFCVLLNDAWQHFPELGPVAFSNNREFLAGCPLPIQIVKGRFKYQPGAERDDNHVNWDHPDYYVFSYRSRKWDSVEHYDQVCLFNDQDNCHYWNVRGGTVSIFAAQFLCWAGVKLITLVGCDCCDFQTIIGSGVDQHRKPRDYIAGKKQRLFVKRNFKAYADGMLQLSRAARQKFGTEIVSLTPFYGLGYHQQQWEVMSGKDS